MISGGANDTSGCHLAVFSEDLAVARHFVATRPPPTTSWLPALPPPLRGYPPSPHPAGMLVVLTTPVKNYLKWRAIQLAIQLAIHSTVGA